MSLGGRLYVGIDPGVLNTGLVIGTKPSRAYHIGVQNSGIQGVVSDVARCVTLGEAIYNRLTPVGKTRNRHIVLAVEGPAFNRFAKGSIQTGALHMCVYQMITRIRPLYKALTVITVPPPTLKEYVTGKGNAGKPLMVRAIKDRWSVYFKHPTKGDDMLDLYDAYGLARVARAFMLAEPRWLRQKVYAYKVKGSRFQFRSLSGHASLGFSTDPALEVTECL